MVFKSFRIQVILRVLLLALSILGFILALNQDKWYVTSSSLFIVSIALVIELIRYVEKTRRDLSNFLFSIKLHDFTSFSDSKEKLKKKSKDMALAFKAITDEFQHIRIEKEMHYQYLQTVIEHINTAMICLTDNGEIALMNKTAKSLLSTQTIKKLSNLKRQQAEISFVLESIKSGEQKLLKIKIHNDLMQLLIRATEFKLQEKKYKLVGLQDIKSELESKELESWQKLIRVMTHEIMNSVTPISSLSSSIKVDLEDENGNNIHLSKLNEEDLHDIHESIITIENRSKGLLRFVETYKNLTKLPRPEIEKIQVRNLFNHVQSLMKTELEKENISISFTCNDRGTSIYADQDMMARVLINLISNANDALIESKNPSIDIDCYTDAENRVVITVEDNGHGMDKETLENVFVPFYTTKEKGSGIGLSLCRQIMHLHKGSITAESEPGNGAIISLKF